MINKSSLDISDSLESQQFGNGKLYSSIFNKISVPVSLLKLPDKVHADVNEAYEKFVGFTKKELIGSTSIDLGIMKTQTHTSNYTDDAKNEKSNDEMIRIFTRAGEERRVINHSDMIEFGGEMYELNTMMDITDAEKRNEENQEQEFLFKTLFNQLPLSTVVFKKVEGDFELVDYNDAAQHFTGGKMESYSGRKASELYSSNPEILRKLNDTFDSGLDQKYRSNYKLISTGEEIYLDATFAFCPPDMIIVNSEDITKIRKTEEDLLRQEQQQHLLSYIGEKLLSADNPQNVVEDICKKAMDYFDCQTFFNYLLDEKTGKLHLNASSGIPAKELEKCLWLDYGSAVCGCVARDNERMILGDIQNLSDERTTLIKSFGIQAYCCHPLIANGKPIGTLSFGSKSRQLFTDDDTETMRVISNLVSVAMQRILTIHELKIAHDESETRVMESTSELKKAMLFLEEEKKRFRDVLDILPVYVILLTEDYQVVLANKFFTERFGESNHKPCYQFLFGKSEPCEICETYKYIKELKPHHWFWEGPDKRNYDIYDYPFIDTDGKTYIVELGIDITEKKLAEEELEKHRNHLEELVVQRTNELEQANTHLKDEIAERKKIEDELDIERKNLQSIFNSVNFGLLLINRSGEVKKVNNVVTKWFGENFSVDIIHRPGDVIGCINALTHPDGCGTSPNCQNCSVRNTFESVLQNLEPIHDVEAESTVVLNNKEVALWLEVNVDPVFINGEWHVILAMNNISSRKEMEIELKESEERNRNLIKFAPAAIYEVDFNGQRFLNVNETTCQITGYSKEELLAMDPLSLTDNESVLKFKNRINQLLEGNHIDDPIEHKVQTKDGRIIWMLLNPGYFSYKKGKPSSVLVIAHDITERKNKEEELYRLNRTLKALSESNQAIMRASEEKTYLKEVCDIIVNDCGYSMSWIGFAEDEENKSVKPVAWAGFDDGYLNTLNITFANTERGRGPTGTAIRTGEQVVCRNMLTDPQFGPWRKEALKRGYASSIALPLKSEGKTYGALMIYSGLPDPWSDVELNLLNEFANDLSFGLITIRLKLAKQKADELIQVKTKELQMLFDTVPAMIFYKDKENRFIRVNKYFAEIMGLTPEELEGRKLDDIYPKVQSELFWKDDQQVIKSGRPKYNIVQQFLTKDGIHYANTDKIPYIDENGDIVGVIAISVDITQLRNAELINTNLLQSVNSGYVFLDLDGRVLEVNDAYCRMSGFEKSELLTMSIKDVETNEKPEDIINHIKSILDAGADRFESKHRRKDGSIFDVEIRVTYLDIMGGRMAAFVWDITEHKRMESALIESEERYRLLFEQMTEGFALNDIICDEKGKPVDYRYLEVNPAFEQLTGLKRRDIIGKTFCECLPNEDPYWIEVFGKVALTGEPHHFDHYSIELKKNYDVFAYCPRNEQFAIIFNDITTRKQTEDTLRETKDYLENLMNYANVPVVVWDNNFVITRFNYAFELLTGLKASDVLGQKIDILFPQDKLDEFLEEVLKTRRGQRMETIEILIKNVDGSAKTVLWNSANIYAEDNITLIATIAQGYDITARKQIEQELMDSEKRFRFFYEEVPLSYIALDIENNFIDVNPSWIKTFGYSKSEIVDKSFYDLLNKDYHNTFRDVARKIKSLGEISGIELELFRKDGTTIFASLNAKKGVDEKGQFKLIHCVLSDISVRKQAEEKIRIMNQELEHRVKNRTASLEAANQELESFSYSVSHDLRAPLRAIDGFSSILAAEHQSKMDDEAKRLIKIIRTNTQKMGHLIDDFLNFARIGRQEISKTNINMNNLVKETYNELSSMSDTSAIKTKFLKLPDSYADKTMIKRVVENLISNAIKFTRTKSERVIEFGSLIDETENIYYIKDNGIGFDMKYVDKLFNVFQRLNAPEEFEGTGVGMAIIKRIIQKHGGRVWAEGVEQVGATIYFTLPKK